MLNLKSSENYEPNTFTKRLEGATDMNLGLNMYAEDRQAICTRPRPDGEEDVSKNQKPTIKKPSKEESKESKDVTHQEYKFLASMVRGDENPSEKIKINFPSTEKGPGVSPGTSEINTINIDVGDSEIQRKETMLKEFDDIDINKDTGDDGTDDLLDLMDS